MKLNLSFILILSCAFFFAQESYLTVNQDSISLSEFKKEYKNNIEAEGFDKAVDTYIKFALLQQEAKKSMVDTTADFRKIFNAGLRPEKDLYLMNPKVTNTLIPQIWQRLQNDRKVEVYAIGIANPYDKVLVKERTQLVNALHENVCRNQKPSLDVIDFKNNNPIKPLWIRPFYITSEIEKVAYATPVNECSNITKSENGNFFVKVLDERVNHGEFNIDYLFNRDKEKIDEAYQQLQDKSWVDVKIAYNNVDTENGFNNVYNYHVNIPDALLSQLQKINDGDVSKPFAYGDGWYIVKRIKSKKCTNQDTCNNWISNMIKNSDYAAAYVTYSEKRANETVKIIENKTVLDELITKLGDDFFMTEKEIQLEENKTIWSSLHSTFTQQDFLQEVKLAKQFFKEKTDFKSFIDATVPKFKQHFTLLEYVNHLEDYEPEYKATANLLKNSIRIHYYIESEIYDKAVKDNIGLQKHLEKNKAQYTFPERYEVEIYRYQDETIGKKVFQLLKNKQSNDEIMKVFENKKNENGAFEVVSSKGKFTVNDDEIDFNPKKKLQFGKYRNQDVVLKVIRKIKPTLMTIKEAGKPLIEDYKIDYYHKALENLKKNATISIPTTFKP